MDKMARGFMTLAFSLTSMSALALVAALLVPAPREAGAAPNCKANNATCSKSCQCCSGVCSARVC